jgi:hypothetical protein
MSENKFKYFAVTTTALVKANSKTDAQKIAMNRRGVPGEVLFQSTDIERITSAEAHEQLEEFSA